MTPGEFEQTGTFLRKEIVTMCYESKAGHVGGSLSSIDLLNILYNEVMRHDPKHPNDPLRDRFILSKGHIAEALFALLSQQGYIEQEELSTFSRFGSRLIGHPNNKIDGIEMNTGALGHGVCVAVGMAIASKMNRDPNRIYCLMGDGEQAEGSVWEAAMAAAHYKLDNLVLILDRNRLQISGNTEDVMALKDIRQKYESFGFNAIEIDGHDLDSIQAAFTLAKANKGRPTIIIAHTIKGKGVSFMENVASWHHGVLTEELYKQAMQELEEKACQK